MPIDRGATVTVQVEFKRRSPYETSWSYFDPTVPKITVYNPIGEAVVDNQDLLKSAVGKYYYIVQTLESWMQGEYSTKATGTDGAFNEVDVTPGVFELE